MASIVYKADGFDGQQALDDSGTGNDVTASFVMTTGAALALLITDVVKLCKIPKGAIIFDWSIFVPDIDSGTALTLGLGLLTQGTTLYRTADTVGQAGGFITPLYKASITNTGIASPVTPGTQCGIPLTVTCASGAAQTNGFDVFGFTVIASATGAGAGGSLSGWVRYNMRGSVF